MFSQDFMVPDAAGIAFVGTRRDASQISGSGMGGGVELFLRYNLQLRYFMTVSTGAYSVTDDLLKSDNQKTILLPSVELCLGQQFNPHTWVQPFYHIGFHFCGASTKFKTTPNELQKQFMYQTGFLGGIGAEFLFKSNPIRFIISGDYRYTFTSAPDPKVQYWVFKAGLCYHPKNRTIADIPQSDSEMYAFSEAEQSDMNGIEFHSSDIDTILTKVSDLQENMDNQISVIHQDLDEMKDDLKSNTYRIDALAAKVYTPPISEIAGITPIATLSYKEMYQKGLRLFNENDYQEAQLIFNRLLTSNPTHEMASNSQYWIGECLFALGKYEEAVQVFNKVLGYQQSHKKDDALLMKGQSYLNLKQLESAQSSFKELLNQYPDSEYVSRANAYLKNQ